MRISSISCICLRENMYLVIPVLSSIEDMLRNKLRICSIEDILLHVSQERRNRFAVGQPGEE